jgi:replication factor C large subunit
LARSKEVRKRREALVEYLAQNLHVSKSLVKTELIYVLSAVAKNKPEVIERLSKALGINAIDIKIYYRGATQIHRN